MGLWYVGDEGERKFSFEELSAASQKAANILQSLGVTRVACFLPRLPEWWIINLATIRAKVTLLPGTTQLQTKDILGRITSSQADCIIASPEVAAKVVIEVNFFMK